jgi:hypothetical protein
MKILKAQIEKKLPEAIFLRTTVVDGVPSILIWADAEQAEQVGQSASTLSYKALSKYNTLIAIETLSDPMYLTMYGKKNGEKVSQKSKKQSNNVQRTHRQS